KGDTTQDDSISVASITGKARAAPATVTVLNNSLHTGRVWQPLRSDILAPDAPPDVSRGAGGPAHLPRHSARAKAVPRVYPDGGSRLRRGPPARLSESRRARPRPPHVPIRRTRRTRRRQLAQRGHQL